MTDDAKTKPTKVICSVCGQETAGMKQSSGAYCPQPHLNPDGVPCVGRHLEVRP